MSVRGVAWVLAGCAACGSTAPSGPPSAPASAQVAAPATDPTFAVEPSVAGGDLDVRGGDGRLTTGAAARLPADFPFPAVATSPGVTVQMVLEATGSGMVTLTLPQGVDPEPAVLARFEELGCGTPQVLDQPPKRVLNCQGPRPGSGYRGVVAGRVEGAAGRTLSVTWFREDPASP